MIFSVTSTCIHVFRITSEIFFENYWIFPEKFYIKFFQNLLLKLSESIQKKCLIFYGKCPNFSKEFYPIFPENVWMFTVNCPELSKSFPILHKRNRLNYQKESKYVYPWKFLHFLPKTTTSLRKILRFSPKNARIFRRRAQILGDLKPQTPDRRQIRLCIQYQKLIGEFLKIREQYWKRNFSFRNNSNPYAVFVDDTA